MTEHLTVAQLGFKVSGRVKTEGGILTPTDPAATWAADGAPRAISTAVAVPNADRLEIFVPLCAAAKGLFCAVINGHVLYS
jgi:hypothetical protein